MAAKAEAVVVGVDFELSYDRLREAALAVARGARLIATNDDPTYPAEDGFWPGAGSILAAVETASGSEGGSGRQAPPTDAGTDQTPTPARPGLGSW